MADLIVICGPQAVGKMTVAESLRDKIKYNLMLNHDSIEISDRIFGFATPAQREFNTVFREKAFELAVKYHVNLVFTYVCAFEMPEEREYLTGLADMFQAEGGNFYFVELSAELETRLARNVSPHRMERKVSKRDVEWSRSNLLASAEKQTEQADHKFLFVLDEWDAVFHMPFISRENQQEYLLFLKWLLKDQPLC